MGQFVDKVNNGITTLRNNKEKENEFLEEYKTRKKLIEATYENDALGRNVLKALEEELIKITEENLLMIDEIINNESSMMDVALKKDMDEHIAWKKRQQELAERGIKQEHVDVEVDDTPVNTSVTTSPRARLNDEIRMRSIE